MSTAFDKQQILVWLTSLASDPPTTQTDIAQDVEELAQLQTQIAAIHGGLARHPERYDDVRRLREELLARRQMLLEKLGQGLFAWVASGGRLELHRGSEASRALTDARPARVAGDAAPAARQFRAAAAPPPTLPQLSSAAGSATTLRRQVVELRSDPSALSDLTSKGLTASAPALAAAPAAPPGERLGEVERKLLQEVLDAAGPPRKLDDTFAVIDELDGLEALGDTMDRWPALPKPTQRLLLAMLVARLRAVKDAGSISPGNREIVRELLALCPPYAKANPMGAHINGLQIAHVPLGMSWRADAQACWATLQASAPKG